MNFLSPISHPNISVESPIVPYATISSKIIGSFDAPTLRLFGTLEQASQYFQNILFDRPLSPFIFSLNKNFKSAGYYKQNAWLDSSNTSLPEINVNPAMLMRQPIEVMQTLVHELCHHYHQIYGKPGFRGYHNTEFSKIMSAIGLECSDTGKVGGKKTGKRMSDYIIPGGLFEKAFENMPDEYKIPFMPVKEYFQTALTVQDTLQLEKEKQQKNKTKYTCLECGLAAWGKLNLFIKCGNCEIRLTVINDIGK